jgi:F-type H+-transporting ATPase subunit alpha
MVLSLESGFVFAILLYENNDIKPGQNVYSKGPSTTLVGFGLLGHSLDPIGKSLEGKVIEEDNRSTIECSAPSIISRKSVNEPLETGIKLLIV